MEKTKKRNELSIFEELRLKPPTNARTKEHYPRENCLHKLNVLCKVDKKNNPLSTSLQLFVLSEVCQL